MLEFQESQELYDTLVQSPHGQKLAGEVRYAKYKPASVTHAEWQDLLGPDVNNLEHMLLMRDFGVDFVHWSGELQPNLFIDDDARRLVSGLAVHDIGEAIKGDISLSDKSDGEEKDEMRHYDTVARHVFPDRLALLADLKRVVFDHGGQEEPLGSVLFAVECVGYLDTALRAASLVAETDSRPALSNGLRWITADVLSNMMTQTMTAQAKSYAASQRILREREADIDGAFQTVDAVKSVFLNYREDKMRKQKVSDFNYAMHNWKRFKDLMIK